MTTDERRLVVIEAHMGGRWIAIGPARMIPEAQQAVGILRRKFPAVDFRLATQNALAPPPEIQPGTPERPNPTAARTGKPPRLTGQTGIRRHDCRKGN